MAASLMATGTIYSLAVLVLANIYHVLERCKHVTQRFIDWWATGHETYFEDNIHHLVTSAILPPSQPKLPKNRGSNLDGKEIRLVEAMAATLEEEIKEHKDESDSSKNDRHWKRPLKKAKLLGDDPDRRGSSALGVPNVPPLSPLNSYLDGFIKLDSDESLTEPHAVDSAIEEEIRRSKMTVRGKDIESPPFKGDACPKEPLQKVSSTHAPLKYSESPLDAFNRQITRSPEHSQWIGEKVVSNFFKKTTLFLSRIEKIHADGLSPLEEYLNSYLKRIDNFNDVQSSYSAQLLSIDKARQLDEKTSAIEEALTLMEQLREDAKKAEAIDQQELEVVKLQDEVNTFEGTPVITEEAIEALATVCRSMEAAREEFKNLKWKL
ncbi:hypothetical protein E5676_scaffold232G00230 [Cucumis melo var. makuwa]|uniref:Uncharacterized protein n=1 Tax=Cucumis melo var. makuwa TaxID=1194695 RepID=A0A5D3BGR0_CUCMM|nr:hypothetical protein E5676_scaffold232G00230 [Cucumis melo var. makuwa]